LRREGESSRSVSLTSKTMRLRRHVGEKRGLPIRNLGAPVIMGGGGGKKASANILVQPYRRRGGRWSTRKFGAESRRGLLVGTLTDSRKRDRGGGVKKK